TLDPKEGVVVSAPVPTTPERIAQIVARRVSWIVRRGSAGILSPQPRQFLSGESIPYLGRQVRLRVEPVDTRRGRLTFGHWSFHLRLPARLDAEARRAEAERVF